jgi:hypothetical protein
MLRNPVQVTRNLIIDIQQAKCKIQSVYMINIGDLPREQLEIIRSNRVLVERSMEEWELPKATYGTMGRHRIQEIIK